MTVMQFELFSALFGREHTLVADIVPRIIDADQHSDDVGFERNAIAVPSFRYIMDSVAADAAVDELIVFGIASVRKSLRDHSHIAFPQRIRIVAVAADIGDAVADKKQFILGHFLHRSALFVLDDFNLIAIRIGDEVVSYG